MPRMSDTSLQASKPAVARKDRIKDTKNIKRTIDPAILEMFDVAKEKGIITTFDIWSAQQPVCQFGYTGICCRICFQGPCRIRAEEGPGSMGQCGAKDYTILARNAIRMMAGGASAHSDHGRHIAHVLHAAATGHAPDYKVTDPDKLNRVAKRIGISPEGKSVNELAKEVAELSLADFGKQDDTPCTWLWSSIAEGRKSKFVETNIVPTAIDRSVAEVMHRTHIGVDADPINIIFGGIKAALADQAGMTLSSNLSDVLFGTPKPVMSEANMGVIDPAQVMIIVDGHNPLLSQMVVYASKEQDILDEAKLAGATGIKIAGICCTGNEVLMRSGVPIANNYMGAEMVIATGAIDVVCVDVQCVKPSLRNATECFDTKLVTTMAIAKIPGSYHFAFDESRAMESAKGIIRLAIDTFRQRQGKPVHVPQYKSKVMAGFSCEAILDLFAAINPENPIKVLTDAIDSGELSGVGFVVGCNNLQAVHDVSHTKMIEGLAAANALVIVGGCAAQAGAKHGHLNYEGVEKFAGPGLKAFIDRIYEANKDKLPDKLPLAWHCGSCVDYTRIVDLWTMMANQWGVDVPKIPFVASAPEAMSEKAVAIGTWAIANGIPTHVGTMPPLEGSNLVWSTVTCVAHDVFGGSFILETDPDVAVTKLLAALEYRTWKLGIHRKVAAEYESELTGAF